MPVSKFRIAQALQSVSQLNQVIGELTEEEILACLDLEAASQRRGSIVDRLISRAIRLNEISYQRQLKEKYHGTFPQETNRSHPG